MQVFEENNLYREDDVMELINELPSMTEAIRCCIRRSGLTDKQVYLELGIDGGQWSRIMNGQAHFPHDRFQDLMRICRSDLPLVWLARKCGYDLKLSQSKLEEMLQKEKIERQKLQNQLDAVLDLLKRANFPII